MSPNPHIATLIPALLLFAAITISAPVDVPRGSSDPARLCYHGRLNADRDCVCDQDYAGNLCERKKHCAGFQRHSNFSCISCEKGWIGSECDFIDCGPYGLPTSATECTCDRPHSGRFCTELKTTDVYLFYNSTMYSFGPLGVLSIIPMLLVLVCCQKLAKKRQLEKVKISLEDQYHTEVAPGVVEGLLGK